MKSFVFILALTALGSVARAEGGCACCCATAEPAAAAATTSDETAQGHPLKGVVVDVLPEQSALLVKHEAIPGVMKAMTMLLKVDAETLKSPVAAKGTAITGLLVRKADGWWLETVKAVRVE